MSSSSIAHSVVMIEVTTRSLSAVEPYRCLGRDQGMGTGFRVDSRFFPAAADWNTPDHMLFLTNFHVVEAAEKRVVRLRVAERPDYARGKVVHSVPALDFAVVAVKITPDEEKEDDDDDADADPFCSAPGTVLANVRAMELHVGPLRANQQKIVCCGFPQGLETYTSTGSLGGRNSGSDLSDMYQIDISVNCGNSGGPVCLQAENGVVRCFGIATATEAVDAQQIAYATPISSVLAYFEHHWTPDSGAIANLFPQWGLALSPRTDAWDQAMQFPADLDGAVVQTVRKCMDCGGVREGDVLVTIHRGNESIAVGKFGMVSDPNHGAPRFSVHNLGFIASLSRATKVTVWRPGLKALRTFPCAPTAPPPTDGIYYQEYADPPYACLGSLVLMNATQDLFGAAGEPDSDDESDCLPPVQVFHALRHVHRQKQQSRPKHVVLVSHFHPNAYVSSLRTLAPGDVVLKINGVVPRDVAHAETLVRKAAAAFFRPGGAPHVVLTTPGRKVFLSLAKLLQEETLCAPERDPAKLHLLAACAAQRAQTDTARKRKRTSRRLQTAPPRAPQTDPLRALRTLLAAHTSAAPSSRASSRAPSPKRPKRPKRPVPVSYTHLTLPTICSV